MVLIRELRDGDVEAFVELRREALLDSPLAFVASPSDHRFSAPETIHEQFSCLTASRILFRNSSWLISLRMQPTTASENRQRHRRSSRRRWVATFRGPTRSSHDHEDR